MSVIAEREERERDVRKTASGSILGGFDRFRVDTATPSALMSMMWRSELKLSAEFRVLGLSQPCKNKPPKNCGLGRK